MWSELEAARSELAAALLQWYDANRRDLPWRRNAGPYEILVSEFMLQQTRVETVIPYYRRFLARFPGVHALAEASEAEVLAAWQGLGYYSRARNLQLAARECAARYGGRVPDSPEGILALPGVGPYVAGAVLSIAFGRAEPAVDGNVMRVFSRLLASEEPIDRPSTRRAIEAAVRRVIPAERPGDFNQALMELGATICTPRTPRCLACPVARFCAAFRNGAADRLPVRGPRRSPRDVRIAVAFAHAGGRVLIARRPAEGLLGGLWEFPSVEVREEEEGGPAVERLLAGRWGLAAAASPPALRYEHVFTHLRWRVQVHAVDLAFPAGGPSDPAGPAESLWVRPEELGEYPFGHAFRPVIEWVLEAVRAGPPGRVRASAGGWGTLYPEVRPALTDPVSECVIPRLAEIIRGSAKNPDGADHLLSPDDAERHAREVWEELRAQDPESFPVLAERLGLRFYLQPGDEGGRVLSAHAWDEKMWRTVGEIVLPD